MESAKPSVSRSWLWPQPLVATQYKAPEELAPLADWPQEEGHHHLCLDFSGPDSEAREARICTTQDCALPDLSHSHGEGRPSLPAAPPQHEDPSMQPLPREPPVLFRERPGRHNAVYSGARDDYISRAKVCLGRPFPSQERNLIHLKKSRRRGGACTGPVFSVHYSHWLAFSTLSPPAPPTPLLLSHTLCPPRSPSSRA